jgi:hypothetical protein
MPVRLLTGIFIAIDGFAGDDFEAIAAGPVETLPQITGTGGCVLLEGQFVPREIP